MSDSVRNLNIAGRRTVRILNAISGGWLTFGPRNHANPVPHTQPRIPQLGEAARMQSSPRTPSRLFVIGREGPISWLQPKARMYSTYIQRIFDCKRLIRTRHTHISLFEITVNFTLCPKMKSFPKRRSPFLRVYGMSIAIMVL